MAKSHFLTGLLEYLAKNMALLVQKFVGIFLVKIRFRLFKKKLSLRGGGNLSGRATKKIFYCGFPKLRLEKQIYFQYRKKLGE